LTELSELCKVGFEIAKKQQCPISDIIEEKIDVEKALDIMRHGIRTQQNEGHEKN